MHKLPAPPVVTRPERLPLLSDSIDYDRFQAFCLDLIMYLPGLGSATLLGDLHHYGKTGDAQQGIDIACRMRDGSTIGVQCKQVTAFTPARVREMVREATYPAHAYIAILASEATAGVRTEIDKHPAWHLWDVRDVSCRVREEVPPQEAAKLIRQHFGEWWCSAFLGLGGTPDRIIYEQTTRQRLGTFTKHQLTCMGYLGSCLGFLIAISSIVSVPQLPLAVMPLALVPFTIALGAALLLLKIAWMVSTGETAVRLLNTLIEVDEDGLGYWSKIRAHCPICEGEVDIEGTPDGFGLSSVGVCERNPILHVFTFDRTTMVGELLPVELRERLQRERGQRS